MYNHYSSEVKRRVIKLYQQGYGCSTIGRELGIHHSIILRWINRYNHLGYSFIDKQPNIKASATFKVYVVRQVIENQLSCDQVAINNGVSVSAVKRWVSKVRINGYESLSEVKPRGRPPKNMGRPKKREPETELEKLRARVNYLETENALLKKVRALVEERIARESGKMPKPSKH